MQSESLFLDTVIAVYITRQIHSSLVPAPYNLIDQSFNFVFCNFPWKIKVSSDGSFGTYCTSGGV